MSSGIKSIMNFSLICLCLSFSVAIAESPVSDIVITTALIPGRPAPILISDKMVKSMASGSVIMDLAAENGGNCSLTQPDQIVNVDGIIIDGTINLAGTMSVHA